MKATNEANVAVLAAELLDRPCWLPSARIRPFWNYQMIISYLCRMLKLLRSVVTE